MAYIANRIITIKKQTFSQIGYVPEASEAWARNVNAIISG